MKRREQLQQELELFKQSSRFKVTNNSISAAVGISPASLSQWLSGNYQGDNSKIDSLIAEFLSRENEKLLLGKKESKFVQTSQSKRIYEALRMSHLEGEIAVVYGEAGSGKTTAIKEYAAKHKDSILIEADLGFTTKILFRELHKKLGYDGRGIIHDMFEEVVAKLKDTGRMLIIDEAEHLPYRSLEMLRRIYDKAGVGIALVGMPRLVFNLRGKRGEFAQLYSRVGIACKVAELSGKDTEEIVHAYFPNSNGLWAEFHNQSKQNARHLSKLIYRSQRIAQINSTDINKQIVKAAAEMLLI